MVAAKNIPPKQFALPASGAIATRIANGASAVIVPAPPAGFMNLAIVTGHNADAALTLLFRLHDADGDQGSNGSAALAAGSDAAASTSGFPFAGLVSDLTAVVSGGTGGTPCEFRGMYNQVPIPTGLIRTTLALTNAYQSIASIVPAAGQNVGYRTVPLYDVSNQGIIVFNGDTANCQPQFRLTRSAQQFLWNGPIVAVGARSAPTPVLALLPGDTLEVKLVAPPVVAGSVLLRAIYLPSP
jgi:hypothetical protein